MTNHEFDLEHMVEMEMCDMPENHLTGQIDQYGFDIEGQAYLEREDLLEVDEAIKNISKQPPEYEQPMIIPVKNDFEVNKVHGDSTKILRFLKEDSF